MIGRFQCFDSRENKFHTCEKCRLKIRDSQIYPLELFGAVGFKISFNLSGGQRNARH